MDDISLLKRALRKQKQLLKKEYWKNEIPSYCPPVLWFGDNTLPSVVATVGANPSRNEFLEDRVGTYLKPLKRRFYHLETSNIEKVIQNRNHLEKILLSYRRYFEKTSNPYKKWFGKKRGGKVESLVNGMGTSFYTKKKNRAVHIDLLPFTTITDFSKLDVNHLDNDVNKNEWGKKFFNSLLSYLKPSILVIFGRTNVDYFDQNYSELTLSDFKIINGKEIHYGISKYSAQKSQLPIIGLNINVGNAYGYSGDTLYEIGKFLNTKI